MESQVSGRSLRHTRALELKQIKPKATKPVLKWWVSLSTLPKEDSRTSKDPKHARASTLNRISIVQKIIEKYLWTFSGSVVNSKGTMTLTDKNWIIWNNSWAQNTQCHTCFGYHSSLIIPEFSTSSWYEKTRIAFICDRTRQIKVIVNVTV